VSVTAALIVFLTVGRELYQKNFREIGRVELDLAIMSYGSGGPDALGRYVERLDRDERNVEAHHGTVHAENASPGLRMTLSFQAIEEPSIAAKGDASAA
jgi:hypothetical protein